MSGFNDDESRWALIRGGRSMFPRFREGWRERGRARWKAWAGALAGGFAVSVALATAVTLGAKHWAPRGLDEWDAAALRWLVENIPFSFAAAVELQGLGGAVLLFPAAVAAALLAAWKRRPLTALTFVLSFFLQKLILFWGWGLWDRARPDVVAGGIAAPGFRSYPSGHVMQAVAMWGLLVYPWFRASRSVAERTCLVLFVAGVCSIVALARFRIGAHWPSDAAAAALLGGAWLAATVVAIRRSGEVPAKPSRTA